MILNLIPTLLSRIFRRQERTAQIYVRSTKAREISFQILDASSQFLPCNVISLDLCLVNPKLGKDWFILDFVCQNSKVDRLDQMHIIVLLNLPPTIQKFVYFPFEYNF